MDLESEFVELAESWLNVPIKKLTTPLVYAAVYLIFSQVS